MYTYIAINNEFSDTTLLFLQNITQYLSKLMMVMKYVIYDDFFT